MSREIEFIEYNGIEGYIELMKHDIEPLNNPECKKKELYYDGKDIKALLDYISNLQENENNFKTALDESSEIIGELEEENNKLKELKKIDEELKKIKRGMINVKSKKNKL